MTDRQGYRRNTVDYEVFIVDVLVVASVLLVLGVVQFLLPTTIQAMLTHRTGTPTVSSLFGHAFVHFSTANLVWNALGYLVYVLLAYALALWTDERQWFFLSLFTVVLFVPVLTGLADEVVFDRVLRAGSVSIRGFSAVVSGVVGLGLVLYLGAVRRRYGPGAVASVAAVLVTWVGVVLATVCRPASRPPMAVLLGLSLALLLGVAGYRTAWTPRLVRPEQLRGPLAAGIVVALGLGGAVVLLFPAAPDVGDATTNVYSHALGFVVGVAITGWGRRYWTSTDWF